MDHEKEEAVEALVGACEDLARNTDRCEDKIVVFFDYYVSGKGVEPSRDDWPDRVLNPKLNGTNDMLKRLRWGLGFFLPHTLPDEAVQALGGFVTRGTQFISALEDYRSAPSLGISYVTEYDVFKYMTTQVRETSLEKHQAILKGKFKAMKLSFYENSKVASVISDEVLSLSPFYHPKASRMRAFGDAVRELKARSGRELVEVKPIIGGAAREACAPMLSQEKAAQILAVRCQHENLGDFAVSARTIRKWERAGRGAAGYTVHCRESVQAFVAWSEGFINAARMRLSQRKAVMRFDDNRDSPRTR